MGNRAVIATAQAIDNNEKAIYIHWNGGLDSIKGFCQFAKQNGIKSMNEDATDFLQIIETVIKPTYDSYNSLDTNNGDNGVYIIDDEYNIVGRMYHDGEEQENYDMYEFLMMINKELPFDKQLNNEARMSVENGEWL